MTEKASWKEGSALVRNEKLIDTLLDSIASGMYVNLACQSVGIDTSTLYQWKKKGQQGIHPYDKVWKRLQIAEAKAVERRLNRIDEAGQNGNWQADAWYLERRYPHLFGKRDTIAIESEDRPKVTLKWADGNILENDEEEDIKVLETKEVVKPELEENND